MTTEEKTLQIEVPVFFEFIFRKAVTDCCHEGRKIKFVAYEQTKNNSVIYSVYTEDLINFYHLGKRYANLKHEL